MSIPTLQKHDNGIYYVHWMDGRRTKRVSTRTSDMAAAKAFLAQWLLMEHERPATAEGFTCADLWALYEKKHSVESDATRDYSWKNLKPHFGDVAVSAVDQELVDQYVEKRAAGVIGKPSKPSTVRRELGALRACWGWAADPKRRLLRPEQVPAFDLPPAAEPKDRWLRAEEIKRLFEAARALHPGPRLSRGELFLWLALETAARKTAILDLTWDRVDFETNVIHYPVPGKKATKKRRANVPISSRLRPVLEQAYRERQNELVLGSQAEVWATVQAIARRAGFGPKQKVASGKKPKATGIGPHTLRHTAATHMARRGVPLWTIAGILGNTVAMVEKVYGHHSPDGLRGGVEMITGGLMESV